MIFAGIGIWLILKNSKKFNYLRNDMILFSLIIGLIGIYVSSAFVRLEVFASLSIIILSSLGLTILIKEFFTNEKDIKKLKNSLIKYSFMVGLIIILVIPLTYPTNGNIVSITHNPPTIMNGGTTFQISSNDWIDSLDWIKNNTPEDSVIAAWWDYGYWIQTKAERTTFVDNATLIDSMIKNIATIFMSPVDQGWNDLQDMEADYFLIFVSGQRLTGTTDETPLYVLQGGGDESKKQWFMKIAGEPLAKYLHSDGMSGTDYFYDETLLGKMIPFTPITYVNFQNNAQSETYQPGFTPVYVKHIKFVNSENNPLKLVYSSPSFDEEETGPMIGIFIYEINKDYVPKN